MGTTGHPGEVFPLECTGNSGNVATFSGEGVSISVAGPADKLEYFKPGTHGTAHFQFPSAGGADQSDKAASAG